MTDNSDAPLDFSRVLASTVSDMQNSLGLMVQNWHQLLERLPPELAASGESGVIGYEALRLNGMLMQTFGLYRLLAGQLPLHPDWTDIEELLQEQLARHQEILQARKIASSCRIDDVELFVVDAEQVGSVIGNVLNNSIRYAHGAIALSASQQDGMLVIRINDDGPGYPQQMLGRYGSGLRDVDMDGSSTALGLYFNQCIANLHQRSGRHGFIELGNGGELGGGEFLLYLP